MTLLKKQRLAALATVAPVLVRRGRGWEAPPVWHVFGNSRSCPGPRALINIGNMAIVCAAGALDYGLS